MMTKRLCYMCTMQECYCYAKVGYNVQGMKLRVPSAEINYKLSKKLYLKS